EPRAAPLHRMERKGNGSHQGTVLEANGGWRAQHRESGWRRLPSRPERHALHDEAGGREDCRPAAGRSPAHSSGKNEDLILFVAPGVLTGGFGVGDNAATGARDWLYAQDALRLHSRHLLEV